MFEEIRCHELHRNTLQNTVFPSSNTFRQFRLEIRCSIQLSYGRVNLLTELAGMGRLDDAGDSNLTGRSIELS